MAGPSVVVQQIQDVTIATITESSIIDPQQIEQLRKVLFDLIDNQDRRKLILDIAKVKHLSSSALGLLIPLQEKYKQAKGKLVLAGVCPGIMKLFTITRLDKMLTFADSEKKAMSLLGAGA